MEPYNHPWECDVLLILFDLWFSQSFDLRVSQSTVQIRTAVPCSSWPPHPVTQPLFLKSPAILIFYDTSRWLLQSQLVKPKILLLVLASSSPFNQSDLRTRYMIPGDLLRQSWNHLRETLWLRKTVSHFSMSKVFRCLDPTTSPIIGDELNRPLAC